MNLSHAQQEASDEVLAWFKDAGPGDVFRLFGYAGTGKTTIAKHIVSKLGEDFDGDLAYAYATYTGKAASVLRSKGCSPCSTIHGLCYKLRGQKPDGTPEFDFINVKRRLDIIIVDEVSMVGSVVGQDLLRLGVPILVLGDPFQLPPIGEGGFFTNCDGDVILTEIHRQAEDSGILTMASNVRHGRPLGVGQYHESKVVTRGSILGLDLSSFDQVICGTHNTRKSLNTRARRQRGYDYMSPLVVGEKVLVCSNNHALGLMNGETATVKELSIKTDNAMVTIENESGISIRAKAPLHNFVEGIDRPRHWMKNMVDLDYGYAITAHKSQGSQWGNVLVVDESYCFRDMASRWLYTAITRAADSVTLAK